MRVHSIGLRRRQVQLPHLLPYIIRHKLNGRLHFGHDALRFLDPLQACLAEPFLLDNSTNRVDVCLDITGNELAVSPSPSIQVNKVVGVTDSADTLGDRLALPGEALVLVASGFDVLRNLLQARCRLWGTTWSTLCRPRGRRPASRGTWWSSARHQEPVLSGRPWPPGGLPAADRAGQWLASCSGAAGGLPVARGEKGTPWRVHQREQGSTGWADQGGGKGAVEKAV